MLKTRIITAVILAIFFLTVLFNTSGVLWSSITLAITLIGTWEWAKLIKLNKKQTTGFLLIAFAFGMFINVATHASLNYNPDKIVLTLLAISTLFWILLAPLWLLTRKLIHHQVLMSLLGLILLMATWLALVGLHQISPWILLGILATVWIADSAAYFAGKRFGKHKLAPEISPGKTWEGVLGALLGVTFYGLTLCNIQHLSRWLVVGLWLIVVLSIMGDLFESLLKRQAGVKDSSHLLPGHGGVLDRIDGLISTLPLVLFYIYFPLFANLQLHVR